MSTAYKPPEVGSPRQSGRVIPPRISSIAEYLELFDPRLVTLGDLEAYLRELSIEADPADVARDLQRYGWLLPLRTRGYWEFAPARRAGAISSGDPFIELRATLARRSIPVAVAYDSAAWLHGLSTRSPSRHALATPRSVQKLPQALSDFRVVRQWGVLDREGCDHIDNLPVWRVATLLVKMAMTPHQYHDWPNVMEWLEEAFRRVDAADLELELDPAYHEHLEPTRVRLAYLADSVRFTHLAARLMERTRPAGVVYFGRPRGPGKSRFVPRFNLVDAMLFPNLNA